MGYEAGDNVFIEATVKETHGDGVLVEIEGLTRWVHVDSVRPDNDPEPTPAASPTRPDGYPPMKMGKPYRVGTYDDDSSSHLNYLTEWGIEFEVLGFAAYTETDVGPFTSVLFRITAVSQMYLDAVAEKQAAACQPTRPHHPQGG